MKARQFSGARSSSASSFQEGEPEPTTTPPHYSPRRPHPTFSHVSTPIPLVTRLPDRYLCYFAPDGIKDGRKGENENPVKKRKHVKTQKSVGRRCTLKIRINCEPCIRGRPLPGDRVELFVFTSFHRVGGGNGGGFLSEFIATIFRRKPTIRGGASSGRGHDHTFSERRPHTPFSGPTAETRHFYIVKALSRR